MKFELPLQIYQMNVISKARTDYKNYAIVSVEKKKKTVMLTITPCDQFDDLEKREIMGSFLNYILQLTAVESLNLEIK